MSFNDDLISRIEKLENTIKTQNITYFKNIEKIITKNLTEIFVNSKYTFISKDVELLRIENKFSSKNLSNIYDDKNNFYELLKFNYLIDEKILKGENIKITTNYKKEKSDTFFFKDGFINFFSLKSF